MRFMMMIKGNPESEAGVMPSQDIFEAMDRFNQALVDAGALLSAEGLHPSSKGARVKFSRGKPLVTDGPFAEAKELIAGYWIIQANSKEEAVNWAKRVFEEVGEAGASSGGDSGEIEVRQLFELEDFPVNEEESGWREKEAEFRDETGGARAPEPGKKQFMILRKADKDTEAGAMPSEELLSAMGAYNDELIKAGVMLAGEGLQPSSKGARVNASRGKVTVTDGPFAEVKELVAGFSLIQAGSLDEAIEWVKRWPTQDGNGEVEVEIRQVFGMDDFGAELTPELREAEERQRAQIAGKK